MKDIIIVCAGTYGREILSMVELINHRRQREGKEPDYRILGYIDDNSAALEGTGIAVPIIGRISDWKPIGDEVYAIGAASPGVKVKLTTMLKARGCRFESLISPRSIVSDDSEMGEGCFITAYSIGAGVKLGNFVNINGSMICPGSFIDDYSTTTGFTVVDHATVGKRVFIGSHAVITRNTVVGDDAQISVGSIVTEDVAPGATVFGVPAKQIG